MSRPILTIAIPAYNVELYIEETILSLVKSNYADKIEILIINDGSSDKTAEVSQTLADKYPSVKVINKKNGGHGSAINTGLKNATGKYFRLLDGDDWFDTKELDNYLSRLQNETADLVLTDYVECFIKSNLRRPVSYYSNIPEYSELDLSEIEFTEWGTTLPTSTIKTSLLKSFGLKIDEHCFYVDQEYNFACYLCARTAKYYPLMIYQYRLERDGQSMERSSLIKNVNSHETVCARLLSEFKKRAKDMPEIKKTYISSHIIIPMCHMQYTIATEYCKSSKHFRSFDRKLAKYPDFYNNNGISGNIINFHRKTNGTFVRFTDLINKYSSHHPNNTHTLHYIKLLATIIIINTVFIILYHNIELSNLFLPGETWNNCISLIANFKSGLLPGLASFNTLLYSNHGMIMIAPIIPFLLLFGTSQLLYTIISFNIYILLPSIIILLITKRVLTRLHLNHLFKMPYLILAIISFLFTVLIALSSLNPFTLLIATITIHYLIQTKLECISHYFIFAIILSFLVFSSPSLFLYGTILYILLFLAMSFLLHKRIPDKKTQLMKILKLSIKLLLSFALYWLLCTIA